jgi:hypothetical protein
MALFKLLFCMIRSNWVFLLLNDQDEARKIIGITKKK